MKTCILLENYVIYDGGKKIPWPIIWEVVRQLDRSEVVERMQKNKKKFVKFEDINRVQATDISEEMQILGIKTIVGESLEASRSRLIRRIEHLNKVNNETNGL